MGQYYNVVIKNEKEYKGYDLSLLDSYGKECYTMAKLTEHSWLNNSTMNTFSNLIFRNPSQIAWVGDYANDLEQDKRPNNLTTEQVNELHKMAWGKKKLKMLEYHPLNTKFLLLVNWTKKEFIDMYNYTQHNTYSGWCLHPLSLMTALGNGLGGGDYRGTDQDLIGSWCFDEISFEADDIKEELINKDFKQIYPNFDEGINKN